MARLYPYGGKDVWAGNSGYTGQSFSALGGTQWPTDVGDEFEAIQDWVGYYSDLPTDLTLAGRMLAVELGTRLARSTYSPAMVSNGVQNSASTWTGNYFLPNAGKVGVLSISGAVTGDWSVGTGTGARYITLSLPSGWVGQSTHEAAALIGWAAPKPNLGNHYPLIGVVHPGDSFVRIIAPTSVDVQKTLGTPGVCNVVASTDLFTCGTAHGLVAGDTVTLASSSPGSSAVLGQPGYCTAAASTDLFTCGSVHGLVAGDPVKIAAAAPSDPASLGQPGFCVADASTDLFTCIAAHGLVAGDTVRIAAADASAFPTGVTIGTTYFVIASGLTTTAFKVSTTSGGSAVDITGTANALVNKYAPTGTAGVPAGVTIGTTYYVIATGLTTTAFAVSATLGGSAVNITADGGALVSKYAPAYTAGIPTGLATATTYYVIASGLTTTAFKLSATLGGSAVDITADGNVFVNKYGVSTVADRYWYAMDGITYPFAFTGDASPTNQDEIHLAGYVLLA